ncbi:hypothetical protein, partial [Klebsiella pneumoniae]|uniref:hypothetical protein n=1 Tax=Klebsiella pneumoniae TaxID=573 RepID=UPI00301399BE
HRLNTFQRANAFGNFGGATFTVQFDFENHVNHRNTVVLLPSSVVLLPFIVIFLKSITFLLGQW